MAVATIVLILLVIAKIVVPYPEDSCSNNNPNTNDIDDYLYYGPMSLVELQPQIDVGNYSAYTLSLKPAFL